MTYKQLTQEQRYQIYAFMKVGFAQKQIAAEISVHPSTVSRELRRYSRLARLSPQTSSSLGREQKTSQTEKQNRANRVEKR